MSKQTAKIDYSLDEAKKSVDSYIDESFLRLQKVINFIKIKKGGVKIEEILSRL